MSMYTKVIVLALLFGTVISHAIADNFYGVFEFGDVKAREACKNLYTDVDGCEENAPLFRVSGGYRFTPQWGAEVGYAESSSASAGMILGTSAYWQVQALQLSGIGTSPIDYPLLSKLWGSLRGELSFLAKLGVARSELRLSEGVSARSTTINLTYGIGAQYVHNNIISARVLIEDWGILGNDSTGTSRIVLTSFGLVYKY